MADRNRAKTSQNPYKNLQNEAKPNKTKAIMHIVRLAVTCRLSQFATNYDYLRTIASYLLKTIASYSIGLFFENSAIFAK